MVLAYGSKAWALLGNIDPENPGITEHFITLSICSQWPFTLAEAAPKS